MKIVWIFAPKINVTIKKCTFSQFWRENSNNDCSDSRWIVEFNIEKNSSNFVYIQATKCRAPFNLTRYFYYKIENSTFTIEKFVKLCLHKSYTVQNYFHFDEIFDRKFKIPILICLAIFPYFSDCCSVSLRKKSKKTSSKASLELVLLSTIGSVCRFAFCLRFLRLFIMKRAFNKVQFQVVVFIIWQMLTFIIL